MIFEEVVEFQKDLKKLEKKFRSLPEDLNIFKKILHKYPRVYSNIAVRVRYREVNIRSDIEVYKVKYFRCKSLSGSGSKSKIRVIYSYQPEPEIILFIEIYFKKRQNTECNLDRMIKYCE